MYISGIDQKDNGIINLLLEGGRMSYSNIGELNLSVRRQNALKRAGVLTLNDLIDELNAGKLKGIRSLGRKSYSEIQTKILVYGDERLNAKEK